ncbi:PREDICTED: uncharacterized protein LOC109585005 [Amphimedon queenslandica]|uniref:Uncharacterized protein n=1 Tax=Amphimedon queenslandica TaxID=400682 RepID=A0AAN0JI93_AMPQE|nr:PREDICTED: uncharacterized protein LOC109585005 [Amphimedon queenslandica]|eukprot:XP_019856492.1 PREDICTED: uncharacterized protein LOC109585005 [Amphimedon queenslandica]
MEREAMESVLDLYRQELDMRDLAGSHLEVEISDVQDFIKILDDNWFEFGTHMNVDMHKLKEIKSSPDIMTDKIILLLDHLVNQGVTYLEFIYGLYQSKAGVLVVRKVLDIVQKRNRKGHEKNDHDKNDDLIHQTGHKVTFADDDDQSDVRSQTTETSGTASVETITFICGCGECTIDQFLTGTIGCKSPGKSNRFPLLDTSKLERYAQMELIDQLNTEADNIDLEFSSLVTDISDSFLTRNVSLESIKVFLCSLESVKARSTIDAKSTSSIPFAEKIKDAESISDLFITMTSAWSWFNIQLFDILMKKFGNADEKLMIKEYELKLAKFLTRHTYEMPSSIHNPDKIKGFAQFSIKLSDKMRKEKATEIPKIQSRFARLLEVKSYAVILTTIKEGCVELCFLVPEEVSQLFPLPFEAISEIRNMEWMILSVKCGNHEEFIREEEEEVVTSNIAEAPTNETDDKQSVLSGSSGVTGSVSTGITSKTRSTDLGSIPCSDPGYCSSVDPKSTTTNERRKYYVLSC